MSIDNFLNRLDKVKRIGNRRWKACCPAHRGTKQSLAIKDDNGKLVVHCFAEQCSINDILTAVGLEFSDVMPEYLGDHKPQNKPFYASDVLEIVADEATIAYLIVKKMVDNTVTYADSQRLLKCASRLRYASRIAKDGL